MKISFRLGIFLSFALMAVLGGAIGWLVFIGFSNVVGSQPAWQLVLYLVCMLAAGAFLAQRLWKMAPRENSIVANPTKPDEILSKRFVYVGADSFREGRICGEFMGQALGGRGKVIILTREHGQSIFIRKSGFTSILEERYPDVQIVADFGEQDRELHNLEELLLETLQRIPDLGGIYVVDGNTPATVIKVLTDTGKAGKIKVVCHDMVDKTMQGLIDGVVTCTISQDPYAQGYDPVIYLYNYLVAGKLPPRQKMTTRLVRVTRENYRQYWDQERGVVIESGVAKEHRARLVDQLPNRPLRIIFLGRDVTFYLPVKEGVLAAAEELKKRNVVVEWLDPTMPPYSSSFVKAVDDYISRKYDGLVLPAYSLPYIAAINRAVDAGIPVATFNCEPDNVHTMMDSLINQSRDLLGISVTLAQAGIESSERAAQINSAVNAMKQALMLESQVTAQAIEITRQMTEAVRGIDRGAQEQTQAAGSVTEATRDISAAVEGTRQASVTSEETSVQAVQTARQGAQTIQQTLHQIEEMSAAVNASAEKIRALNLLTHQIDSIVNAVNDMAEQSNLLALNASIEAARASEDGNGFAVVASEIRTLAEKSRNSTKEIGSLVRAVQKNSAQMVDTVGEATRQAQAGSSLASQAGLALDSLVKAAETMREQSEHVVSANASVLQSLDRLGAANQQVAAVIVENAGASRQVTQSIEQTIDCVNQMTGISQENVQAIEDIHQLSDEVANQADRLKISIAALVQMAEEMQGAVVAFKLSQGIH